MVDDHPLQHRPRTTRERRNELFAVLNDEGKTPEKFHEALKMAIEYIRGQKREKNQPPTLLSPDEVPWKTSSEYVREYADELDLSDVVMRYAEYLSQKYGFDKGTNGTPKGIATGAIYYTSLKFEEPITQEVIYNVTGVTKVSIRNNWQYIADQENDDNLYPRK